MMRFLPIIALLATHCCSFASFQPPNEIVFVDCGASIYAQSNTTYVIGFYNSSKPNNNAATCPSINGTVVTLNVDPSLIVPGAPALVFTNIEVIVRNTTEVVRVVATGSVVLLGGGQFVCQGSIAVRNITVVAENVVWFGQQSHTELPGWTMLEIEECVVEVSNITVIMTNVTIGNSGSIAEAVRGYAAVGQFRATLPRSSPQWMAIASIVVPPNVASVTGFFFFLTKTAMIAPVINPQFRLSANKLSNVVLDMKDSNVTIVSDVYLGARASIILVQPNASGVSSVDSVTVIVARSYVFWNESCDALWPNTCVTIVPTPAAPGTASQSRAHFSVFSATNESGIGNIVFDARDCSFVNIVYSVGAGSENAIFNVFRFM
ncbi:GPI-anchored surface protein, putative [Bodo saltans]|uniref:GPI-anchored surface protein, putative n=1 Tax=Bodo saltans TaxID=75058 RepID=A0A0S4J093_BODSA|nr:GPI-anchored surface protein, putative [Bodo saltans]|eukprot:CUG33520.1 GPI-anchored surface protein, putative [Bodo saltans]